MPDNRLKMIYDLLPVGTVCDIGTDHCKIPVFAVEGGKCATAYGSDLRRGPLRAAKRFVEERGLSDRITLFLSDGFRDIPDHVFECTDCFVIAGMGGELIADIISKRPTDKHIVVQPMTAVNELIAFLCKNGYSIEKRVFCHEGGRHYTAMLVKYDGMERETGLFSAAVKNDDFYAFVSHELARTQTAISGLECSKAPDTERLDELYGLRALYRKELENEGK